MPSPELRNQDDLREPLIQAAAEYLDAGDRRHAEVIEALPVDGQLVIQMDVTPVPPEGVQVPIPNKDPDRDP